MEELFVVGEILFFGTAYDLDPKEVISMSSFSLLDCPRDFFFPFCTFPFSALIFLEVRYFSDVVISPCLQGDFNSESLSLPIISMLSFTRIQLVSFLIFSL